MIFACIALIYLGYVLFAWARGDVVEGWTSVISVVLVMGSIQLIVMGILGEYVGRIFMEAKQRPMFLIADIVVSDRHKAAGPSNKKIVGTIRVSAEV
jgi:dolichol-phosphate mannosyltransferase